MLFARGDDELYTRELARRSFLALRTVQDELAKLEAAKLIVSRSNGYRRFYRANRRHPLYPALHELVGKGGGHPKPLPRQLPSRKNKSGPRR